jgi:hypothetical protein
MNAPDANESTTCRLSVSSRFALRGIWVQPDALGQEFTWNMDQYQVTLALPQSQGDFTADDEPEIQKIPALMPTARITGSGEAVSVHLIKVTVKFSGPISAATKAAAMEASQSEDDSEALSVFGNTAQQYWEEGHGVAARAAHTWLSYVRVVSSQPWLGIAVEPPVHYGRSYIMDDVAGVGLMAFGPKQSVTIRSGLVALALDQLNEIQRKVENREEYSAAEALLADARFLAREAEVVDSQRAILIAAIAAEIKSKLTIRQKIDPAKSELLNLVLDRVSNLPKLLDTVLEAAFSISLRTSEPQLYEKMQRLNILRNHVVHRGIRVEQAEGRQLVVAAGQLFDWLDRL